MKVKQIISISPVSRPTWAKMCTAVKSDEHSLWDRDKDDWWYVEVVQWANVIWVEDNGDEYPAIFGCCMATEANVGLDFVETYEGFLTYTTERPAHMDCVDAQRAFTMGFGCTFKTGNDCTFNIGSDIKK